MDQIQKLVYDAIIIGGGPAGSACAYDLAIQGKKVLIIEKESFPRFKPCAGMLTVKSLNRLPYSIKDVVQWTTLKMELSNDFKNTNTLDAPSTLVATTVRSELDDFCLKQALSIGAELKTVEKGFDRFELEHNQIIKVHLANGESLFCRYLVGADGAHSKVRKQSQQFEPDRTAVALEGRVPFERIKNLDPKLVFDFNVAQKGYAWLIPKEDHINVGLYTRRPDEYPISKTQLRNYTELTLGTREIDEILGFPIGTGGEYFVPPKGNILLVGDAAGFAEPIFGEGIHNAIKSGQFAAESIVASLNENKDAGLIYAKLVEAVRTDVWWCRQIARAFYKFTFLGLQILARNPVKRAIMEGFAGGLTIKECLKALSPIHKAPIYGDSKTILEIREEN